MVPYKKSYPKKSSYRKKASAGSNVSTAVKKYVKRAIKPVKPEVKRQIDYLAEDTMNTLATPYNIYEFVTAQGTTKATRLGTAVRLIGCHIKTIIKNNANQTNMVRVLLLSTEGSTDTTLVNGEFFQDANLSGATTTVVGNTGLKLMTSEINRVKFKVHMDTTFKLGNSNTLDSSDIRVFSHFHKFNTVIQYEANTYGVTNQNRRFFILYLGAEGPEDLGLGQTIEVTGQHKWYFTDA